MSRDRRCNSVLFEGAWVKVDGEDFCQYVPELRTGHEQYGISIALVRY
jgi:hypothetical protein